MGFYGNITNTSNTTFSFDRIYPNRLSMDANANNDGIFIGRYVLVEYQEEAAYPVAYHATETSEGSGQYYFYSSTNQEEISKIKYLGLPPGEPDHLPSVDDVNAIYQDGFYKGEILQRYIYSSDKKDWIFSKEFYACVGEDDKHFAIFELIADPSMKSHYIQNFEIDEKHYGQESKGFKGYDSTVWMKSSVTASDGKLITKYVNIADLNSVVPTFDIAADAPTMNPITPHFDADSTNVYYKLHMQSPYGFRVAKKPEGGISDADTVWYETTYDKTQDKTETKKVYEGPADIYYNEAGFSPDAPSVVSNTAEDNYIKLEPTASSGATYSHGAGANDIQEFRLHLPAIGNMMSKAWDIVHGPNRDDAQTDDNSSLQGRLDSFKAMEKDAIPMKRNTDGTFVGSRINGNSNRTVGTNKILEENLSTSFDQDDAWIRTEIDTTGLDNTNKLSGISIHHTWHKQADTTSATNKNTDNVSSSQVSDKIDLYTPIVDKAGHVVGKNTETVTLPYGFKTIATNGRGTSTAENASTTPSNSNIVAESTQDTLNINSGNKWIRMDTAVSSDTLIIAHDIHETSSTSDTTDWTKTEANTTIPVPVYSFDDAGHYESHHTESYKLPFGYGKIVGDAGNSAATATYDQIKFTSDEWLTATITEEGEDNTTIVTYSHDYPNVQEDTSTDFDMNTATIQDNKDKIVLETLRHDNTGHIIKVNQHTVTLPYGYKTIKIANSSSKATAPAMVVEAGQSAGQTQDTLNLNASNKWIVLDNAEGNTIKFGHKISPLNKKILNPKDTTVTHFGDSFNLLNFAVDEAGHITGCNENEITITIPQGDLTDAVSNGADVITQLTFDKPTGHLISTRTNVGTLKLTGYELPTYITGEGELSANATINDNFGRLEFRLNKEVSDRENAIEKEVSDRNTAITNAIAGIFNKNDDNEINKLAEIIEWINNNPSTATQMQKAIQDNTKAISDEANLARSEEDKLAYAIEAEELRATAKENEIITALTTETGRAIAAELGLQEQIDALGTAAQKDIEDFATATQGTTAETTAATIATYGDIVTYNAEDFVLKSEYNALLSDFNELKTLVEQLNNQINPPQQPDNSGEIV